MVAHIRLIKAHSEHIDRLRRADAGHIHRHAALCAAGEIDLEALFVEISERTVSAQMGAHGRFCNGLFLARRNAAGAHRIFDADLAEGIQLHDRKAGKDNAEVAVMRVVVRHQLIAVSLCNGVGAPVIGIIFDKADGSACAVRHSQLHFRPLIAVVKSERAVKRVALPVIAQRHAEVFKRRHQRRFAFLARILDRPEFLHFAHRLHGRRIRRTQNDHRRNHRHQRQHFKEENQFLHRH